MRHPPQAPLPAATRRPRRRSNESGQEAEAVRIIHVEHAAHRPGQRRVLRLDGTVLETGEAT